MSHGEGGNIPRKEFREKHFLPGVSSKDTWPAITFDSGCNGVVVCLHDEVMSQHQRCKACGAGDLRRVREFFRRRPLQVR